jgi:hypothetical protein
MKKKKCNKCNINKPFDDYHKRSASPDGMDATCKVCRSKYKYGRVNDLKDADEKFRIPAEEILTNLGFELYNPDNPVYKQFNKRIEDKYGIVFK